MKPIEAEIHKLGLPPEEAANILHALKEERQVMIEAVVTHDDEPDESQSPAGSETLFEFLQNLLRQGPIECPDDKVVCAFLAQDLADLQGIDAVGAIRAAFQRSAVDMAYVDWPDAETMCQNANPGFIQGYAIDFLSDYRAQFTGGAREQRPSRR